VIIPQHWFDQVTEGVVNEVTAPPVMFGGQRRLRSLHWSKRVSNYIGTADSVVIGESSAHPDR